MPPAAGVAGQPNRTHAPPLVQPAPAMISDGYAKDSIIAWFRGEFAAANAIIDALCNHLTQLEGGGSSEYESLFSAIHRRRMNWIPILQMQKYYSIADVAVELRKVAAKKAENVNVKVIDEAAIVEEKNCDEAMKVSESDDKPKEIVPETSEEDLSIEETNENGNGEVVDEDSNRDDSPESDITDSGSQEVPLQENIDMCSNHANCEARRSQIKITKGFTAKEHVRGHMVNVVRGLKLYENVLTDSELSKLKNYVNELRVAGQNGELPGETFVLYNQQVKGNKRELIQLGIPIFGHIEDVENSKCQKSQIEPIPALLQDVIEHLIQWHLISENRKPNGCIINFYDEGEYSQPFAKPPHLEQPIFTLVLSEATMAFGRTLVSDSEGNYRGTLILPLQEGSLLFMRGKSAETARHVMTASPNKRVSITFFRVRTENENGGSAIAPLTRAMTLWQPGVPTPNILQNGALNGCKAMDLIPKWGVLQSPMVMLAPARPVLMTPRKVPRGGTGVFLPWTVGPRKPARHLPPRAQKGRYLALPSPVETDPSPNLDEKGLS